MDKVHSTHLCWQDECLRQTQHRTSCHPQQISQFRLGLCWNSSTKLSKPCGWVMTQGQKGEQGPGSGSASIIFHIGAEAYKITPYPWNPLLQWTILPGRQNPLEFCHHICSVMCSPYKEIHVTAKYDGKILTTCHAFWLPGKIVQFQQCGSVL